MRPFGKLMDILDEGLTKRSYEGMTLGRLAEELGEPVERIMDALDACKERAGQQSYISVEEDSDAA